MEEVLVVPVVAEEARDEVDGKINSAVDCGVQMLPGEAVGEFTKLFWRLLLLLVLLGMSRGIAI